MILHILNGDALCEQFVEAGIDGDPLVFRECLIEGPVSAPDREAFWKARAEYLELAHSASKEEYLNGFAREFSRLSDLDRHDGLNLWFGDDLFCQVNLWCCLELLGESAAEIFRVFPSEIDFGNESADDLRSAFDGRVRLGRSDVALGRELWNAFVWRDAKRFADLGDSVSGAFRRLPEVCRAAAEIESRPLEVVRRIVSEIGDDFPTVFREFSKREAIYGLGDVQVRRLLDSV